MARPLAEKQGPALHAPARIAREGSPLPSGLDVIRIRDTPSDRSCLMAALAPTAKVRSIPLIETGDLPLPLEDDRAVARMFVLAALSGLGFWVGLGTLLF